MNPTVEPPINNSVPALKYYFAKIQEQGTRAFTAFISFIIPELVVLGVQKYLTWTHHEPLPHPYKFLMTWVPLLSVTMTMSQIYSPEISIVVSTWFGALTACRKAIIDEWFDTTDQIRHRQKRRKP